MWLASSSLSFTVVIFCHLSNAWANSAQVQIFSIGPLALRAYPEQDF
jgi:hypothetical protein